MTTLNQVKSRSDEILAEIEEVSRKEFLPIIGPLRGQLLAREVRNKKPKHVLEVGTLIGYSAILMGQNLDERSEIVTIEIHKREAEKAAENILKSKIQPKVKIIIGDAKEIIPTLKGCFDFVFIDAEKAEYSEYLKLVEPKLSKGAVVFADNAGIFAQQMFDYLKHVRNPENYTSSYVQLGDDGVEISIKCT